MSEVEEPRARSDDSFVSDYDYYNGASTDAAQRKKVMNARVMCIAMIFLIGLVEGYFIYELNLRQEDVQALRKADSRIFTGIVVYVATSFLFLFGMAIYTMLLSLLSLQDGSQQRRSKYLNYIFYFGQGYCIYTLQLLY